MDTGEELKYEIRLKNEKGVLFDDFKLLEQKNV